jgi:16S rRNA (uracil1498-N3)-methyltransferase
MRRFFIDPENINGRSAVLVGAEARHIAAVLRLTPETTIILFDGSGSYYEARIMKISPTRVEARIVSIIPYIPEAEFTLPKLHLAIGLLKGKKMDFVIQKSTELGIESLHPYYSQYCAVHDATENKLSRWQKIAHEACKQCNRPKPPDLYEVTDYNSLLVQSDKGDYDLKILFWEDEEQNALHEMIEAAGKVLSALVIIGPEGGFSQEEAKAAIGAGFKPVTLGSRILRAETAAIAAVSILQHELGNLV